MKDETFGPIIGVQKVSSDQEAISLMNKDGKAEELADQVEAGTVFINRFILNASCVSHV